MSEVAIDPATRVAAIASRRPPAALPKSCERGLTPTQLSDGEPVAEGVLAGGYTVLLEDVGAAAGCSNPAMRDVDVYNEGLAGLDVSLMPSREQVVRGEPCRLDMHHRRLQDIESDGLTTARLYELKPAAIGP